MIPSFFKPPIWLLTLCFSAFCASQAAAQEYRTEAVRHDLLFLQKALYKGHPGVFRYQTRTQLDCFFDSLRHHLPPEKMSALQAHAAVLHAVAAVKDGHTSVLTAFFDDETRVLPLSLQFDAAGEAFVWRNYTADSTLKRGTPILEIDGKPVQQLTNEMKPLFFGDGHNRSFADALAPVHFGRYYHLLYGPNDSLSVTYVGSDGATLKRRLATKSRTVIQKMQEMRQSAAPAKKMPLKTVLRNGNKVALQVDTMQPDLAVLKMGNFPNRRYRKFYRKMFKWLEDNKIQQLAIDLRYNTGGNIRNMDKLISYIAKETIRYDYTRKKRNGMWHYFGMGAKVSKTMIWVKYNFQPGFRYRREGDLHVQRWRVRPHKRHHFDGKVFVITNGWSFSSASMCASFLKHAAGATLIGTETGGGETGNCGGGFPSLRLPNTKFRVRFPLFYLRYDVGKPDLGRGVMPDYPIQYNKKDLLEERDLEMEKVRNLF